MWRARYWAWLAAASWLLVSAPGWARVPTRLVYSRTPAASDCPDEAALAAAVAARLGYEPFSPWGDQTILATVTRSGGIVVGRAELIDHDGIAQGSREVKNAECSELVLALALAISITLDPMHVEPAAETKPISPPDPAPPEEPQPPSEAEPEAAQAPVAQPARPRDRVPPSRRTPVTWHVAAAAIGALEAAPHPTWGGRLGLAARRGRWSIGIEAWGTWPMAEVGASGGEVRVRLLSAALTPCLRAVGGLSFCALGSLGSMRAEGSGVETPRTESVLHATAGGRALFVLPLGSRFELLANADLAATLNRPRFQLDQVEVWRPGPVMALLGIGASTHFF